MSRLTKLKNYSSFVKECRFFYCQSVFEGDWDGKERYILCSDTSEEELKEKYPEIIDSLSPYMFCSSSCGDAYEESLRNIDKFKKRRVTTVSFDSDDAIESQMDVTTSEIDLHLLIEECLSICTSKQRERIIKYFVEGMSLEQIADGRNISVIQKSISAGINKIKNFYGVNG